MSAPAHEQRFVESVVWIKQMLPDYKITSADHLTEARQRLLAGDPAWTESLVSGLKHSNQLNWRVKDDLIAVVRQHPEQLRPLLELLWPGPLSKVSFNAFVDRLHPLGGAFATGAATSMALGPEEHPSYRPEAVRDFWAAVRWPEPKPDSEPFEKYRQFLESLKQFRTVANANGLAVPDLLTAQGYMWLITTYDSRTVLPAPALETFRAWRGDSYTNSPLEDPPAADRREALLTTLAERPGYLFTGNELEQFTVQGETVPLSTTQGASVVPQGFDMPVAVMLPGTITAEELIGSVSDDGLARHRLVSASRAGKPDEGLLRALEARAPIVLLVAAQTRDDGNSDGTTYQAIFPVYVHRYTRRDRSFEFDVNQAYAFDTAAGVAPNAPVYERRWSLGVVKRRLHHPLFSRDVLAAYEARCAVCGLDVAELLDAAHIVPDRDEAGVAWVRNGMALCKNHHAAYDANLLGVSPGLTVKVAPPLLPVALDRPAASDTISSLDGASLKALPRAEHLRPDPDLLAVRLSEFQRKWSIRSAP
jgi:putative restriction endonuclease